MNTPMRFAVESWSPDYGTSIEADLELTSQRIDPSIEVPVDRWAPITPHTPTHDPGSLLFVDGVRRVDARIWIEQGGSSQPGLCATIGAGVVEVAVVVDPVRRAHAGTWRRGNSGSPLVTGRPPGYPPHATSSGTRCALTVVPKTLTGQTAAGEKVDLYRLWNRRHTTKFNGVSYIAQRGAEAVYTAQGKQQTRALIEHYLTNAGLIRAGGELRACNAVLLKSNQCGTLTELIEASAAARALGWNTIMSGRSGESEDVTLSHLAVGLLADQIKVGSITRAERTAKWNEVIRIEEGFPPGAYWRFRLPG